MPIGIIILVVVSLLIYLGLLHRVLDRMRLSDRAALAIIGAMVVGTFLTIPIIPDRFLINVGGALIPLGIIVYLVVTADEAQERVRALSGAAIVGAIVYAVGRLMPAEPGQFAIIDPAFAYGIAAGAIGYLTGRSRRASFVAGAGGVMIADIAIAVRNSVQGIGTTLRLGGAGVVDAIVIAGLIGVGLAEIVGEARERVARVQNRDSDENDAGGEGK